jgi:hypothetical protein
LLNDPADAAAAAALRGRPRRIGGTTGRPYSPGPGDRVAAESGGPKREAVVPPNPLG